MVAEAFELADEVAGVGGAVVASGEPVGAEVLVEGVGLGRVRPLWTCRRIRDVQDTVPEGPRPKAMRDNDPVAIGNT